MVARASDPAKRPRGWTLHTLPTDEVVTPETPQSGPAAVLEASSDLCGRLLGARYDVKELLSHGERGAVYLAHDRNYGRMVALRLSAPQAVTPTGEDVRALARRRMGVRHPYLAAVQGEGLTEGGLHYVAMEHVEGRNLLHMIGDPRLRWPTIHTIGTQVAEALVALHGAWVVHGDVHPGNMVWTEDAERTVSVKLVDLDVSGRDSDGYLPPGFSGERDSSCDVYALVASLYELSTGAAPSPGFAALSTVPDLPEWFAQLVRSVLQTGSAIPSVRGLLASLRGAGGVGVPSVVMRVPSTAAPAAPMVHAPTGPLFVAHAPSGPVPRVHAPSVPVPVVHAPSVPVVMAHAPSVPVAMTHAPSVPVAAAVPSEDELWFAAVAEFDPLQHLESMMAAARAEDVPELAPQLPEAPVLVTDLEPPPPFGGEGEGEAPVMVTMRAAFDPRPSPVLGVPVEVAHSIDVAIVDEGEASASGPIVDVAEDSAASQPIAEPAAPGVLTREYEATAEILLNSRRRTLYATIAGIAAVVLLLVWRFGVREAPVPAAAPVVPAPVAKAPVVKAASEPVKKALPKPAPVAAPVVVPEPSPVVAPEPAPEPASADEPEAVQAIVDGARQQVSAHEFRQIMLRSNRSPAIVKCYVQHTAGVEQKVEVVVRVSSRGRVQKLKIDEGPLGDCIKQVVERLEFPRAAESAQHQFVFRTPVQG